MKNLFFLPEYTLTGLEARGYSFTKFTNNIDSISSKTNCYIERTEKVTEYLYSILSKYDVEDIIKSNILARQHLDIPIEELVVANYDQHRELKLYSRDLSSIINALQDPSVDIRKIILSSHDSNVEVPYLFQASETTIYIILQNAFSNFIVNNVNDFKYFFVNTLIIYLFKTCDEKDVLASKLFSNFNKMLYAKIA